MTGTIKAAPAAFEPSKEYEAALEFTMKRIGDLIAEGTESRTKFIEKLTKDGGCGQIGDTLKWAAGEVETDVKAYHATHMMQHLIDGKDAIEVIREFVGIWRGNLLRNAIHSASSSMFSNAVAASEAAAIARLYDTFEWIADHMQKARKSDIAVNAERKAGIWRIRELEIDRTSGLWRSARKERIQAGMEPSGEKGRDFVEFYVRGNVVVGIVGKTDIIFCVTK